jgi:hypothetical protein
MEFHAFYGIRKFITLFTTAPPLFPILSQIKSVQALQHYFLKRHFNIVFPPMPNTCK